MSEQAFVLEATHENFDRLVVGNSRKGPVLVDFRAEWAGPSLRQRELLPLPNAVRGQARIERLRTHLELILAARDAAPESDLKARLTAAPDRSETRFALAAVRLMADDSTPALAQLSELHRRDPGYRGALPRRALLVLLDLLGSEDGRTRPFRQMLFDH